MADDRIRFLDLKKRNDAEHERINRRVEELKGLLKETHLELPRILERRAHEAAEPVASESGSEENPGGRGPVGLASMSVATPAQREYYALQLRARKQVVDRVFTAVSLDVAGDGSIVHKDGVFPSQQHKEKALTSVEREIAATCGILIRDNKRPGYRLEQLDPEPDGEEDELHAPLDRRFVNAIAAARGEYRASRPLFDAVLAILRADGAAVTDGGATIKDVNAADWAAIVKTLADDGVAPDDLYLKVKVRVALNAVTGGDDTGRTSSIDIDLPSLEDDATVEIVQENLQAMQAIYFSAMLEELRLFQVADKLVELFHAGVLPFGRGKGGDLIFDYWRRSNERFTEVERLNLYARCFGFPGGEPMQSPNREFDDLWLRFLSAVSSFFRQITVDQLLRAAIPAPVTQEAVRKSGRDLAANLSLYGYGVAYFAATSLQEQIKDIIEILQTDDVKGAYGARDMWQVVDQVASLELGGARNTVRYRTMAQTGATIIRWLGGKASDLSSFGNVIDETEVRRNIRGTKPMRTPTDRDLVDACEQWLAVTGTPDQQVEQYAQPVEAPNSTSRPIQIPQAARDLLESVGVSAGMNGR